GQEVEMNIQGPFVHNIQNLPPPRYIPHQQKIDLVSQSHDQETVVSYSQLGGEVVLWNTNEVGANFARKYRVPVESKYWIEFDTAKEWERRGYIHNQLSICVSNTITSTSDNTRYIFVSRYIANNNQHSNRNEDNLQPNRNSNWIMAINDNRGFEPFQCLE